MKIAIDTNIIYDYLEMNKLNGDGYKKDKLEKIFENNDIYLLEGSLAEFVTSNKQKIVELRALISKYGIKIYRPQEVKGIVNGIYPLCDLDIGKEDDELIEMCCDYRSSMESYFLAVTFTIVITCWCSSNIDRQSEKRFNYIQYLDDLITLHKRDIMDSLKVWLELAYKGERNCDEMMKYWLEMWTYRIISYWQSFKYCIESGLALTPDNLQKAMEDDSDKMQRKLKKQIENGNDFWRYLMNKSGENFDDEIGAFKPQEFVVPRKVGEYLSAVIGKISGSTADGHSPHKPLKNDVIDMLVFGMFKDDMFLLTRDKYVITQIMKTNPDYIQKCNMLVENGNLE